RVASSDLLGGVSEFCACPDYRESVGRCAFLVELQGNLGTNANHNGNYLRDSLSGKIDVPAVRVLRPGTFSDFREWKIQKSGGAAAVGQVKVPQAVVGRVICDV
ncbi:hypothetical protein BKA83DRAFT_4179324, partial [Pisolithus microcarpus]